MSYSFPNCGNPAEVVGQTPRSARVPLDPLLANISIARERQEPARGPAADQGVRPTINAAARLWENYRTLGLQACRAFFAAC